MEEGKKASRYDELTFIQGVCTGFVLKACENINGKPVDEITRSELRDRVMIASAGAMEARESKSAWKQAVAVSLQWLTRELGWSLITNTSSMSLGAEAPIGASILNDSLKSAARKVYDDATLNEFGWMQYNKDGVPLFLLNMPDFIMSTWTDDKLVDSDETGVYVVISDHPQSRVRAKEQLSKVVLSVVKQHVTLKKVNKGESTDAYVNRMASTAFASPMAVFDNTLVLAMYYHMDDKNNVDSEDIELKNVNGNTSQSWKIVRSIDAYVQEIAKRGTASEYKWELRAVVDPNTGGKPSKKAPKQITPTKMTWSLESAGNVALLNEAGYVVLISPHPETASGMRVASQNIILVWGSPRNPPNTPVHVVLGEQEPVARFVGMKGGPRDMVFFQPQADTEQSLFEDKRDALGSKALDIAAAYKSRFVCVSFKSGIVSAYERENGQDKRVAVALCTTPPNRSMLATSFSVTFGTVMVAGRTSWLQARMANIAVWPLLCAIMLAKAWPTGPLVRPIRISGIASVNWPSAASTVASPAWKT